MRQDYTLPSTTSRAITDLLALEFDLKRARERIGRSIYERRVGLGLAGAQLARIAKVNASELSKCERGMQPRGLNLARTVDAALTALEAERNAAASATTPVRSTA